MHVKSLVIAALSLVAANAVGQASLVSRESKQRMIYVYGGGGDVASGDEQVEKSDLLLNDFSIANHVGSRSGTWAGQGYSGSASLALLHTYQIDGPIHDFHTITYNGDSTISCSSGGIGGALADSINPGNELILEFNVGTDFDYRLSGTLTLVDNVVNDSFVTLQRFDGLFWGNVYTTHELGGLQGTFFDTDSLPAGEYRIVGNLHGQTLGNEGIFLHGDYLLQISQNRHPSLARIVLGRLDAGNLASLVEEDFDVLTVCKFFVPNQSAPPINVELETTTTMSDIGEIDYRHVSNMVTSGSFVQTLQMYDFSLNQWSTTAQHIAPLTQVQDRREIVVDTNPERFVGPNGLLRTRYQIRQTGPAAFPMWCQNVNKSTWVIWKDQN